jgi:response regulator RpfG family c-di-GMP phosphodiesterase
MNDKVLIVDDEENVLHAIKRHLRGQYDIFLADSAEKALDILKTEKHFALIITDFKMPETNGLELLLQVKEISPETIRMMLTGHADFESIIGIINDGHIFRFLTKPCPPELLRKHIQDGIKNS